MLELKNITHTFEAKKVLDHMNLVLDSGTINTIIAPNGTGKTTLLSIIAGLLLPNQGEVIYSQGDSAKDVVLLLSGDSNLYRKNTVEENVYFFGSLMGLSDKEIEQKIRQYGHIFPMYADIKNALVEKLSYGQKRLVALFSAVISGSKYILIDEVSEGLDLENVNLLSAFLKEIKEDRVIILASQDYKFSADVSDHLLFLKNGKIQDTQSNATEEQLIQTYVDLYMRSK